MQQTGRRKKTVQLYGSVHWAKHTLLLVSRGFHHGRSISVRGLGATERGVFFIAVFVLSSTFHEEVMGTFPKVENVNTNTPISTA